MTGSESAAPPRRPGSALLTPNRSTPLLRAPTAFTRHYQQLHHGRSLAVVSDGLVVGAWRAGSATAEPGPSGNGTTFYVWMVDEDAKQQVEGGHHPL